MGKLAAAMLCSCLCACGASPEGVSPPGDDGGGSGGSGSGGANGEITPNGPYPIVLAHGMFGFDHIGPLDYFYGVKEVLTAAGRTVFTPRVDPLQATEVRGPELQTQIDDALVASGADKVIIIAHSQGGLDARWVAHFAPTKVAAVITIATPHHGTSIADTLSGAIPKPADDAVSELVDFLGLSVESSDLAAQLAGFTTANMAAWNANITDAQGVAYYSIAGRSNDATDADGHCNTTLPFLSKYNRSTDAMGVELSPLSAIMKHANSAQVQDGLVAVDSAKWGTFLGCVPADHFDEVCQIANDSPGPGNNFDCHTFYGDLERFLSEKGF